MWLCHYLCLSLRWLTGGVTDGARHDIPVLTFPRADGRRVRLPTDLTPQRPTNQPAGSCRPGSPGIHRGLAGSSPGTPAGEGKGPGQRLRTEVRPVGNGLGLRCLLGARAPSTPNPLSSRISAAGPLSPFPMPRRPRRRLDADAPRRGVCSEPDEPVGPASEPGAGLSSNIPRIEAMSTAIVGFPATRGKHLTTLSISEAVMFTAAPARVSRVRADAFPGSRRCFPRFAPVLSGVRAGAFRGSRPPAAVCRFCPARAAHLSGDGENLRSLPSWSPRFRGMDHPTWRRVILSAPVPAADAALPLRR
jgi:hypothetical protein